VFDLCSKITEYTYSILEGVAYWAPVLYDIYLCVQSNGNACVTLLHRTAVELSVSPMLCEGSNSLCSIVQIDASGARRDQILRFPFLSHSLNTVCSHLITWHLLFIYKDGWQCSNIWKTTSKAISHTVVLFSHVPYEEIDPLCMLTLKRCVWLLEKDYIKKVKCNIMSFHISCEPFRVLRVRKDVPFYKFPFIPILCFQCPPLAFASQHMKSFDVYFGHQYLANESLGHEK
jgi:hypothetical protein